MTSNSEMSREERVARAFNLCVSFARNLAYYRVGRSEEYRQLFDPGRTDSAGFWLLANGNSLDMCALEWCKLFADRTGTCDWRNIVADSVGFAAGLLDHLALDYCAFQKEIKTMREYRDKWVAHQDSNREGFYPNLEIPKKAVWFYHAYIVSREVNRKDLSGLPLDLDASYQEEEHKARAIYQRQVTKAMR
jgi:hypothetical protein